MWSRANNFMIVFWFCFLQFFLATTTECDLCNKNGKCVLDGDNTNGPSNVRCECQPWFAGRNCQINLQLLLIVGCVSVILMIVIACCVSCLCCRDRHNPKNSIPCKFIFYLMFIFKLVGPGFDSTVPNQRHNLQRQLCISWDE